MADPLNRFGADDLLQDLDLDLNKPLPGQDSGDEAELDGSGLDRYRMLDPTAGAAGHPEVTYGQLVAPPSYEDSLLYENAPHHHGHAEPTAPAFSGNSISSDPGPRREASASAGAGPSGAHAQQAGQAGQGQAMSMPPPLRGAGRPQPALVITVTDPVRRENAGIFGLKAGYTSYLVTTRPVPQPPDGHLLPGWAEALEAGASRSVGVRRRFNNFVALADCLKARFRGYFLPPRPEKNAVEGQRASDAFVRERRAALERYLNALAAHPAVASSEELRVFLTAEGELDTSHVWASLQPPPKAGVVGGAALLSKQLLGWEKTVVDPVQAAQPTQKSAELLRAIKETAHAYAKPLPVDIAFGGGLPAGEVDLRGERVRLEGARDALAVASRGAEKLVHRMERLASVHGDLGLAMLKLFKFEESEGPHLAAYTGTVRQAQSVAFTYKTLGAALVRVSRVGKAAVGRSALELGALHDQLALMPAAVKGLKTREKQLLTLDTLKSDMESRSRTVRELDAQGQGNSKKAVDLRNDVAKLECSVAASSAEYNRILDVNQKELVRLRSEFRSDLMGAALALAASQAAAAERAAEVWMAMAQEAGASEQDIAPMRAMVRVAQLGMEQGPGMLMSPDHPHLHNAAAAAAGAGPSAAAGGGSKGGASAQPPPPPSYQAATSAAAVGAPGPSRSSNGGAPGVGGGPLGGGYSAQPATAANGAGMAGADWNPFTDAPLPAGTGAQGAGPAAARKGYGSPDGDDDGEEGASLLGGPL